MTTRRDALVKAGLAKPGRGKFSTAAKAWLDTQRAAGVKFSDDDKPVSVPPQSELTKKSDKPVKADNVVGYPDYISPSDYRFPEGEYKITFSKGFPYPAKTVGMRNVCDVCHLSLLNHVCDSPTLFGYAVKIEKR